MVQKMERRTEKGRRQGTNCGIYARRRKRHREGKDKKY